MASPNTLALRAQMAALQPAVWRINRPQTPPSALKGEFPRMLRESGRIDRAKRRAARAAAQTPIPTSGPGRRRAKTHRNRGLCLEPVGDTRCTETALHGEDYCAAHLTVEKLRKRGALEVADIIDAQAWRRTENAA